MEESVFSPCVVQGGTKVLCCPSKTTLAYIHRNKTDLVLLKWRESGGCYGRTIHAAHNKPINSIIAAPKTATGILESSVVTCGTDGIVKLWNTDTLTAVKAHVSHKTNNTQIPVIVACWSSLDPNVVISVGQNGCFVVWHIAEHTTIKHPSIVQNPTAIVCSPTDVNVFAVGYQNGVVGVIRTKQQTLDILHRLRVSDIPVVDLAWRNLEGSSILAVATSRGELSFWNADANEGKRIKRMVLPGVSRHDDNEPQYPLLWTDNGYLLCRGGSQLIRVHDSEILGEKINTDMKRMDVVHAAHRRHIMVIAAYTDSVIWTVGSDRVIMAYNMNENKIVNSMATLYAGPICGTTSALDANKLVFGGLDGCVRVWDASTPTGNAYVYSRNIKDKVTSVTCHPTKDCIAYATSMGRVGIIENNKAPMLIASPSNKDVYWLVFGPSFLEKKDKPALALYVVTNQCLFVYEDPIALSKPRDFGATLTLPHQKISDVAWKPDYSLLAVGCFDGSIAIFRPPCLTAERVTTAANGLIQYLSWHPDMTASDDERSPHHDLLTFGSRDPSGDIRVLRVSAVDDSFTITDAAILRGHHEYVQAVSWNPHVGGQLVSTSNDKSIQIWDVVSQTPLKNFNFNPGVFSPFAFWSPIDPDIIISGSSDGMIHIWRISQLTDQAPPKPTGQPITAKYPQRKIYKEQNKQYACEMATQLEGDSAPKPRQTAPTKPAPKVESSAYAQNSKRVELKSIFNSPWTEQSLYEVLKADDSERENHHAMKFLASDSALMEFENKHETSLKSAETSEGEIFLALCRGDLKERIRQRIDEGGLTDQLVAMATSVSPRFWLEACQAYARQLKTKLRPREAANYFIAARQVEEAIEVLVEGDLHLEALCLARHHLSRDHQLFKDVLLKYAKSIERNGELGRSAECYIYLKDFDAVANALNRDKVVPDMLRAGAVAAKYAENKDLEAKLALKYLRFAMFKAGDTKAIPKLLEDHPELECLKLLTKVHEALTKSNDDHGPSILSNEFLSIESPEECYCQLEFAVEKAPHNLNDDWITWTVVKELCLARCAKQDKFRLQHILKALDHCSKHCTDKLYTVCRMLSPTLEHGEPFTTPEQIGISFRAFLCLALLKRAETNREESAELLERITRFHSDLLDEKAFEYCRTRTELLNCEKMLTKANGEQRSRGKNVMRKGVKKLDIMKVENGMDKLESKDNETASNGVSGSESNEAKSSFNGVSSLELSDCLKVSDSVLTSDTSEIKEVPNSKPGPGSSDVKVLNGDCLSETSGNATVSDDISRSGSESIVTKSASNGASNSELNGTVSDSLSKSESSEIKNISNGKSAPESGDTAEVAAETVDNIKDSNCASDSSEIEKVPNGASELAPSETTTATNGVSKSIEIDNVASDSLETSENKVTEDDKLKNANSENVTQLMDERKRCWAIMNGIESERIAMPNAVQGFFMLRNFYLNLPENEETKEMLVKINEKYEHLTKRPPC